MNEHITHNLNSVQHEVVTAKRSHQLVLAGAGSGKTRVLAHRMAWLLDVEKIAPEQILAVTFTNKAAREMTSRIEKLVGPAVSKMWIGTFHGLAHRFLRIHAKEAELDPQFQIIDSEDQLRVIKRVLKNLELDESKWPPKSVQSFINHQKDEGCRAERARISNDAHSLRLKKIYEEYEKACQLSYLVDFPELLLRMYEMLCQNDELRQHYQYRFREILVDEFQDTNSIQYLWLRLLVGKENFITAVGDDDQSIYSWRGAKPSNLNDLCKDFDVTLRLLEQNYRSTESILKTTNALIKNNHGRMGKNLWTDRERDSEDKINVYTAYDYREEAEVIKMQIEKLTNSGEYQRKDCAVFYRSNAQSRILEDVFVRAGIPYRIYGGLRFFDRAEIKDAMAYMRLVANPHDDAAFERVVNQPARGLGEKTILTLREMAYAHECSLWAIAQVMLNEQSFTKRTQSSLQNFMNLIESMTQQSGNLNLAEQTAFIVEHSGLIQHYRALRKENSETRAENLAELISSAAQFNQENSFEISPLSAFLANASLDVGEEFGQAHTDCVQLMTLHSAKGLEFPVVFICGLEEGLFPHQMCQSQGQLEEERRLCYVGMTRAMKKLYLTHATKRIIHGRECYHLPSRFLSELPAEELNRLGRSQTAVRTSSQMFDSQRRTHSSSSSFSNSITFKVGENVKHPAFGEGVVVSLEGTGLNARVFVNFEKYGSKWLLASYSKLTKLASTSL